MTTVLTLVNDINKMLSDGKEGVVPSSTFLGASKDRYSRMLSNETKERKPNTLYFSEIGESCPTRLWYKFNNTELAIPHNPSTKIKFLYGDILEELVLQLARDSGHSVEGEQQEVQHDVGGGWVVRGRIDAIIDGTVVDVKSVTKYSVKKFEDGLVDDPFGYVDQLNGYASVLKSDTSGFLTIEKELGHIRYFSAPPTDAEKFSHAAERAVTVVSGPIPHERLPDQPQSATSPNRKLCTKCSYCEYKFSCWADANDGEGLRGFVYSTKVEWLTSIVSLPKVMEIKDYVATDLS